MDVKRRLSKALGKDDLFTCITIWFLEANPPDLAELRAIAPYGYINSSYRSKVRCEVWVLITKILQVWPALFGISPEQKFAPLPGMLQAWAGSNLTFFLDQDFTGHVWTAQVPSLTWMMSNKN